MHAAWAHKREVSTDEHTKERWALMSTQRRDERWWVHKDREMSTDEHTKEKWALMSTQMRDEHWWAHKGEISTDEHTKETWEWWAHKGEMSTDEYTKQRWALMSTQRRNENDEHTSADRPWRTEETCPSPCHDQDLNPCQTSQELQSSVLCNLLQSFNQQMCAWCTIASLPHCYKQVVLLLFQHNYHSLLSWPEMNAYMLETKMW